jgi:hypothetical protein
LHNIQLEISAQHRYYEIQRSSISASCCW